METSTVSPFLDQLLADRPVDSARGWLGRLRGQALEQAHGAGVPTVRDEDWRFTDLSPLYKLAFRAPAVVPEPTPDAIRPHRVAEAAVRMVFVDGRHSPALSSAVDVLPAGLKVERLGDVDGEWLRSRLGAVAAFTDDAFVAINTAHLQDGAVVVVDRDVAIDAPVHLLFVSTQPDAAAHPRVLVVAEPSSDVTVIEEHMALHDGAYCVNAVTEVIAEANARVRHVKLQRDGKAGFHLATSAARVERDARFHSHDIAIGGRISRQNLRVALAGEGSECHLDGLALIDGRQLADTHSFVDHAVPHGISRQRHKCVVGGGAHAVFNGRVLVRSGAQQTDSAQQSRNLLLSERARVDAKPQLEIFADDVKCAHGATVGQLELEEVFYLRSRGLDDLAARNLLTYAFAAEIVDAIGVKSVVERLRAHVMARTGAQETLR
ncbi:MAG: Fe-S cluster assembly protein SufD [Burkholderiales bacterium]|nr:Fe-S cluster assembly protein SufD [Burkholderiales bacterium]